VKQTPFKKQKPASGWFISCCVGTTKGGENNSASSLIHQLSLKPCNGFGLHWLLLINVTFDLRFRNFYLQKAFH